MPDEYYGNTYFFNNIETLLIKVSFSLMRVIHFFQGSFQNFNESLVCFTLSLEDKINKFNRINLRNFAKYDLYF